MTKTQIDDNLVPRLLPWIDECRNIRHLGVKIYIQISNLCTNVEKNITKKIII